MSRTADAASPMLRTPADRALTVQRIVLAGIVAAHGVARWWAGAVDPFGEWLGSQGIPVGYVIAYAITVGEIIGAVVMAHGRWAFWPCVGLSLVYLAGIVLVHAPSGWFVVGLGRNGMEYSVLLIVCLLSVAYQRWPWPR